MFIYIFLNDLSREIVNPSKRPGPGGPKVSLTSDCTPCCNLVNISIHENDIMPPDFAGRTAQYSGQKACFEVRSSCSPQLENSVPPTPHPNKQKEQSP